MSLRLGKEAKKFDLEKIKDRDIKRKLDGLAMIGSSALPKDKLEEYNDITTKMSKTYNTAKVPSYKDKTKLVSLEPGIKKVLRESRDPAELEYYWTQWRNATGKQIRKLYMKYVDLTNEAAR